MFELDVLIWLEGIRTDFLNSLFEFITILGEHTLLLIILLIIYFAYDKRLANKFFFIIATSLCFNGIIKNIVKMPRPWTTEKVSCVRPETATGYSFPSGHTQNMATYGTAFALKIKKHWFSIVMASLILVVAFSRMYLGAHYPSDVIVGVILGIVFSVLGNYLYDKVADTNKLFIITIFLMVPFALFFLINPDSQFVDFYKLYGLLIGVFMAGLFEKKFVSFDYKQVLWKKIFRVILGLIIALLAKEGLKVLFGLFAYSNSVIGILIFNFIRYFLIAFITLGIYPLLFKKLDF